MRFDVQKLIENIKGTPKTGVPFTLLESPYTRTLSRTYHAWGKMVGLGRLELPTFALSGQRSNHLSYRPKCGKRAYR